MKPVKIHIDIKAVECYIYIGHIFIITPEGDLLAASLTKIIKKFIRAYPKYFTFIRLLFLRNDFLTNTQGDYFISIPSIKQNFQKEWKKLSNYDSIYIGLEKSDFIKVLTLPELPVYEIKAYAMRLYISTKKGLYEIIMNSPDGYRVIYSKLTKIFDQKIIGLNAKASTLFISAGKEGLFHGSYHEITANLTVKEKSVNNKSLKTSWSGYDIFNYSENNHFDYLINEITKNEVKQPFSKFDERREKYSFGDIGSETISMSQLLENSKITPENIKYCFNSSKQGFFILNTGEFYAIPLIKETIKDKNFNDNKSKQDIHFSRRLKIMPNNGIAKRRPISSHIIPNGCVIENFSHVTLIQHNKTFELENESVFSVRTYMNSIRYKNIVSIVKENCITLYSLYPFFDNSTTLKSDEDSDFLDHKTIGDFKLF